MKRGEASLKATNQSDSRGCCCKRSACRKKYCECFRMNVSCSNLCKCIGCGNNKETFPVAVELPSLEDNLKLDLSNPLRPIFEVKYKDNNTTSLKKETKIKTSKTAKEAKAPTIPITPKKRESVHIAVREEPIFLNFINSDVVEASVQCMIAQANECIGNGLTDLQTQRMVLEEFGRCLLSIVDCMEISVED